jgi:AcrR family transcriptional regulator
MISNPTQRTYHSPLREQQAERTRERIIEAFVEQVIDQSMQDFSIARVAKQAGVSTRTVYHHFPNRESILAALQQWFDRNTSFPARPPTVQGVPQWLEAVFRAMEENEALVRAVLASNLAGKVRAWGRPQRRQSVERIVRSISPDLSEAEVHRGAAVLHYLVSMNAWQSLRDESGMSAAEVQQALIWAATALIEDLSRQADRKKGGRPKEGVQE